MKLCRARSLQQWSRLDEDFLSELLRILWGYPETGDPRGEGVIEGVSEVCGKAVELVLDLLETKAEIVWGQAVPAYSLLPEDRKLIGPYVTDVIKDKTLMRVLFGPVWKVKGNKRIRLLKGQVLTTDVSTLRVQNT
jgi:hypothetical protein